MTEIQIFGQSKNFDNSIARYNFFELIKKSGKYHLNRQTFFHPIDSLVLQAIGIHDVGITNRELQKKL